MKRGARYINRDHIDSKNEDLKHIRFLLGYVKPFALYYGCAILSMILAGVATTKMALSLGHLVEEGLYKGSQETSFHYASLVVMFFLTALSLRYVGLRVLTFAASKSIYLIRVKMFEKLGQLPISYFDKTPRGRTVTRITHDVEGVEGFFISTLATFTNYGLSFLITASALLMLKWQYALLLLSIYIPAVTYSYLTRNYVRTINRDLSKHRSGGNAKLSEYLNGMEIIRAFGLERVAYKIYEKKQISLLGEYLRSNSFYAVFNALTPFLCTLPLIVHFAFGGYLVTTSAMSIGLFITIFNLNSSLSTPIVIFMRELQNFQLAISSVERIYTFMTSQTENDLYNGDGDKTSIGEGDVEFDNVEMSYDTSHNVLSDLSFKVTRGEKIGVVGHTGCGKTTTLSLLVRLYDYQKGKITIDGHDLRDYKRSELRRQIGFVTQDVQILKGSLRENLICGDSILEEHLEEIIELTGFLKIMKRSGLTLDSQILENGANLSAGEKQMLALTRVLLKRPKILVMDEATSNIDPLCEELVHDAIFKTLHNKTCFIIAHRLDTLNQCDRIFVFDKGKLIEEGRREELLMRDSHYKALHQKNLELSLNSKVHSKVPSFASEQPSFS